MDDTTQTRIGWFHLTPGRFVLALLAIEVLLWLSDRFGWLGWHKGYAVLTGVATVGGAMLVMGTWFAVALVFRRRFQFSLRMLLVMVVVVAVPCSWLAVEMKKAREQRQAVELFSASCIIADDGCTDENGNLDFTGMAGMGMLSTTKVPTVPNEGPLVWLLSRAFFFSTRAVKRLPFLICGNELAIPLVRKHTERDAAQSMLLALKNLPDLRVLDLSYMPVDDSDLEHVTPLKELRQLDLTGTQVTNDVVAKLQQALPNCKITR